MSSDIKYSSKSMSISRDRLVIVSTSCAADLDDLDVVSLCVAGGWTVRLDRHSARTLSRVLRGLLADRETSFTDASTGALTHAKLDSKSWTIGGRPRVACVRQDWHTIAMLLDGAAVDLGLAVDGPIIETDEHERKEERARKRRQQLKEENA